MTTAPDRPPLRVLHLFRSLDAYSGGPLTYLENLYAALNPASVLMRTGCVLSCAQPATIPAPVHLGTAGQPALLNAVRFGRWLWRELPAVDLVHIHGAFGWHFLLGAALCRCTGRPYVVSSHGLLSAWYLSQRRVLKGLYLRLLALPLLRRASVLVAMTAQEAAFLHGLGASLRLQVASPGLPMLPAAVARPAGSQPDILHVLFIGRLSRVKGLPLLLQAVAMLRRRNINVHLDLAGDTGRDYGPDRLLQDIAAMSLGDTVTYHGFVQGPAKQALLLNADVLALPSYSENFSYVTAEALAAGVPAVVTDAVGMADLIRRYRCGSVIPPGDADALAQALAQYRDPTFRQERAQQARACAEQELSLEATGRTMEALYKGCAQGVRPNHPLAPRP